MKLSINKSPEFRKNITITGIPFINEENGGKKQRIDKNNVKSIK